MKLTEAITALNNSAIEDKDGILEAINTRLQETEGLVTQVQSLQTNLDNILGLAGVTEGDLTQKLEKAQETINGLKNTETSYQQQLAERDKTIAKMQQETLITEVSRLTNANSHVLKTLVTQNGNELLVKEGKAYVKNNDQEMELQAYAQDNWKDFVPSLFPNVESTTTSSVTLPGGNSSGEQPKQTNVVDNFLDKQYSGVNDLFKQAG